MNDTNNAVNVHTAENSGTKESDEQDDNRASTESRVNGNSSDNKSISHSEKSPFLSEDEQNTLTVEPISKTIFNKNIKVDDKKIKIKNTWQKEDVESNRGEDYHTPPDGGFRAWLVMIGSFVVNGVLFSIINTYSLIYLELQRRLTENGETEVSSKVALVGSLTIGTTFLLSPIAGILTDKIGIQTTTFLGGALASGGMLLSSIFTDKVDLLYLTYGLMYGIGASLAYTPSLAILGHYFKKYLGLVNGFVTAGSSVFTIILPYMIDILLQRFGLEGTLRSLAILTSIIMGCALLFKPLPLIAPERSEPISKKSFRDHLKEVVNVSIWKKKQYVVWASSIPFALFGYFVPYVHIGKFVAVAFEEADGKLPVMCIGITSGIGRLVFGYIADLPKVNRILLQQISFVSIGILTMLVPGTSSFVVLLIISLGMGLFDGCFISLVGPIAFDICGRQGATQAIGFLFGMCSVPLTVGPPIAGLIYDHTHSYNLPFMLAGLPPIIGALMMFLIKCVKNENDESTTDSGTNESTSKATCQNGKAKSMLLSSSFMTPPDYGLRKQKTWNAKYGFGSKEISDLLYDYDEDFSRSRYSETAPLLYTKNQISCLRTRFYHQTTQSSLLLTV